MIESLEQQAKRACLSLRLAKLINDHNSHTKIPVWIIDKFGLFCKVYNVERDGANITTGQMLNLWS